MPNSTIPAEGGTVRVIVNGVSVDLPGDVYHVLTSTADRAGVSLADVLSKAIFNEALISEQHKQGRTFFVRDKREGVADVEFA